MSRITVALCTYQRYPLLDTALELLARQDTAPTDYTILVVDNSPDRGAAEEFARRWRGVANCEFRFEPRPGLSHARNAAVAACRDPLIAFMDDDAVARPDWVRAYLAAFEALGAEAAAIGGAVDLVWELPRPPWLHDGLLSCLSAVNLGRERRELAPTEALAGTNIAFRRGALDAAGGFSPSLGRYGHTSALLSNEESELVQRLRAAGGRVFYEPRAIVDHRVHGERLTREWFRRRMAWQTVSEAITAALRGLDTAGRDTPEAPAPAAYLMGDGRIGGLGRKTEGADAFALQIHDIHVLLRSLLDRGAVPPALTHESALIPRQVGPVAAPVDSGPVPSHILKRSALVFRQWLRRVSISTRR